MLPAHDRMRLERLCRYAGRPPVATERLSLLPDGRLLYRLKRRWRDGTTHMIFEPLELVEKLAALVPPPRFNLVRYNGILAPSAAWRPLVIPSEPETADLSSHPNCPARKQLFSPDTGDSQKKRACRPRNYSWSQLMRRVFTQ
ncbi:MAG: transposase [Acidobacteriota bacterium]